MPRHGLPCERKLNLCEFADHVEFDVATLLLQMLKFQFHISPRLLDFISLIWAVDIWVDLTELN